MCDTEKKKGRGKWCLSKNKRMRKPLFFLSITSENKCQHSTVLLFSILFLKKRSLGNTKIHKSDLHSEKACLSKSPCLKQNIKKAKMHVKKILLKKTKY